MESADFVNNLWENYVNKERQLTPTVLQPFNY